MKNARIQPLILLTFMFAAFIIGLFVFRTTVRTPVQIQPLSAVTSPDPAQSGEDSDQISVININTATAEQIQQLPNVGQVLAERIIAYREEHGAYKSVGELIHVPGIGTKKLESIWDLVTVGG